MPLSRLAFRSARGQDTEAIIALVRNRIDWMNENRLHQWNETDYFGRYPYSYWHDNIESFLVAESGDEVVAAMALYTDDVRWTRDGWLYDGHPSIEHGEAFYLHHLVASTLACGAGRAMMLYAEDYTLAHGKEVLRLDSAIGNSKLNGFYTALGYSPCGTCHDRLYHGILREKRLIHA